MVSKQKQKAILIVLALTIFFFFLKTHNTHKKRKTTYPFYNRLFIYNLDELTRFKNKKKKGGVLE